jgi:hypothetical protein
VADVDTPTALAGILLPRVGSAVLGTLELGPSAVAAAGRIAVDLRWGVARRFVDSTTASTRWTAPDATVVHMAES